MDRDKILLTPGPLTTTLRTKLAMLRDWGSWDADFNAVTARIRHSLLDIVQGHDTHVVVPLQGSGTFSVEAAVARAERVSSGRGSSATFIDACTCCSTVAALCVRRDAGSK